ncbi:MAG: CRTAC1 family protein [Gammaproteobacteria bacterium]|nr:CRTAC1 family protein [Gammaproteobacteria bacterium]
MSAAKLIKSILSYLAIIVAILIAGLFWLTANDRAIDYQVNTNNIDIPTFVEQTIDFVPTYDKTKTIPFTASAVIDIDGDGLEELFFGGGINQADAFYKFENGKFSDITAQTGWVKQTPDKTFGSIALDLDTDGDVDMLVARQSGVWLYNNENGKFTGQYLDLEFDEKSVPLSVAVSDLNRDGLFDMYVAGYIARKHVEGETIFNIVYGGVSALFINKGNNQFENITRESGLYYQHNTFQGIFIDVDGDSLEDLVVAHDTGTVKTWKNMGNLKFKDMPNPTSNYFSYPMGIAVSDYNNDGSPDFYFSNVGSTTPDAIVRGDLREEQVLSKKWIMFENKGGFRFEDVADKVKLADYEFSWGALFEDFNLDGRDDLVVSENYVGFPTHIISAWRLDGRFMIQNESGEFAAVGKQAGIKNRNFGISPLTADFNQDGYPDLVHVNLQGPQRVFISAGGNANYLKVQLPNTVGSVGAKVQVVLEDGTTLHQTFVVGEGLCSDQSHNLIFGLGAQSASSVSVTYLDGQAANRDGRYLNQQLTFK